jgi:hypothetical protein
MRINDINREDLTVSGSNVKLKQSNRSVLIWDVSCDFYFIPKNSRPIFDPTNIHVKPIRDILEWSGIVL